MKIMSLFANIGVAEAYLSDLNFDVVIANEIIKRRAELYKKIYPNVKMIDGDITNPSIFKLLVDQGLKNQIDIIMATPPCQGMSTAGHQLENDERNKLIIPVIQLINILKPKYVFLENVPNFANTQILYNSSKIKIFDLIYNELKKSYFIRKEIINTKDYEVPQNRERTIILMTRKDQQKLWILPEKSTKNITMRDAIGDIPDIDPYIKDVSEEELLQIFPDFYIKKERALKISRWNNPPHHIKRQVIAMLHTPTGCTAFDNTQYYPIKADGKPVRGYHNTYKRQNWDTPAYTITMDNRKISSQNNVHPGRMYKSKNGEVLYSDARVLTLYEIMLIMTLPSDWPIPKNTSEAFLRRVIGEGIPPLFVKKVFENLR